MEQAAKKKVPTAAEVLAKQKVDHAPGGIAAKPPKTAPNAEAKTAETPKTDAFGLPAMPASTTVAAPEHADMFQQYADAVSPRNIIGKLLKFAQGDYVAGEGGEKIKEGTKVVAIMDELSTGWVRWQDNKPIEHRVGRVIDKFVPAQKRDLPDRDEALWETDEDGKPRDPWQFVNYLPVKNVETDEFYTLATGTRGGLSAIADLCRHYARDVKQHPDCFPVIALKSGSYPHKNKAYGRVKIPILTPVGRTTRDGAPMPVGQDMSDEIPF